jgi:hypothetical protein
MSIQFDRSLKSDLPVASGGTLSNLERGVIDQNLKIGAEVWLWNQRSGAWLAGVVVNTALLEDRCLFEVRCKSPIESNFLEGHGVTLHSGFHGVDWFLKHGETSPPEHVLASFPNLIHGRWFRIGEDEHAQWGQVGRVNSAKREFSLSYAVTLRSNTLPWESWATYPFHDSLDFAPLPLELAGNGVAVAEDAVVVLPEPQTLANSLGKAAFRVSGYDPLNDMVLLECLSMLCAARLRAVPQADFTAGKYPVFGAEMLPALLERFPALKLPHKKIVRFLHNGAELEGETADHRPVDTLPAFLELLQRKSARELRKLANQSLSPEVYNRYQVDPDKIIAVRQERV